MKEKNSELLALTYATLNAADYITTKRIIKTGGQEYNPLVKFLIKKKLFGAFKIVSTLLGMTTIYLDEKPRNNTKFLIGLYSIVVANNVNQIIQHEKSRQKK